MKFLYLANIRLPTEKAHGLQIAQMCEAFAKSGAAVTLIAAQRINTPEMAAISDVWAYYGVAHNFAIRRIACIDLFRFGPRFSRIAFALQSLSYTLMLILSLLRDTADIYYSRDILTLLALSLIKPRYTLYYEAHQMMKSRMGSLLQRWCVQRVGMVVAVTAKLAADLKDRGAVNTLVEHDGFQIERFANLPDRQAARAKLGLPADHFIVGYTGRLQTMSLSKGIDTLIDAIAALPDQAISLCLVGGPKEVSDILRQRWIAHGLPTERFLFQGHVAPPVVPIYMAAFDVCAMPLPDSEHFRYYASSLKLFEYMATAGTILSTNLPATAEVLHNDETALLVPPGDLAALADALKRLYEDPALRDRLGRAAQQAAPHYSWQARAERILQAIRIW
ncbi:MAG: glycosyltransferase [Chloroflexota bacterium]